MLYIHKSKDQYLEGSINVMSRCGLQIGIRGICVSHCLRRTKETISFVGYFSGIYTFSLLNRPTTPFTPNQSFLSSGNIAIVLVSAIHKRCDGMEEVLWPVKGNMGTGIQQFFFTAGKMWSQ